MSLTTSGISWVDAVLESSANASTWTDMSGFSSSISQDGGERATEDTFTFQGDTPILGKGKRSSKKITVNIVYTEGVSDAYATVRAAYEAGSTLYLRWVPKGKTASNKVYTTSAGIVTKCPDPAGEAESAKTVLVEFELACATVTESTFTA